MQIFNTLTRLRRSRCKPQELLILIPSCLQFSQCRQKVTLSVSECRRCGRCKVKDLIELAEQYGARCAMATGGRLAVEIASQPAVKAVVAVACEKELLEGAKAIFPKPSLGIINVRPNGPCKDTDVDLAKVRRAVAWLLRE